MTQKANANQQPTVKFFRGKRHVAGRAAVAVPQLRRVSRHAWHFLADAILIPGGGDVNLNLEVVSSHAYAEAWEGQSGRGILSWPGEHSFRKKALGEVRPTRRRLDEDEEEDEDDEKTSKMKTTSTWTMKTKMKTRTTTT